MYILFSRYRALGVKIVVGDIFQGLKINVPTVQVQLQLHFLIELFIPYQLYEPSEPSVEPSIIVLLVINRTKDATGKKKLASQPGVGYIEVEQLDTFIVFCCELLPFERFYKTMQPWM